MKILTITITMALLASTALYVAVINVPLRPVHRSTYLIDRTDTFEITPNVGSGSSSFSWDETKQGRHLRFRKITDVTNEQVTELHLEPFRLFGEPDTWALTGNGLQRKKAIEQFESSVTEVFQTISHEPIGHDHSAILEPLVSELIALQDHPDDDRHLYLFSDLGQNTHEHDWVNSADTIQLIAADDLSIWEIIDGVKELKDLTGISVHIIHRAVNSRRDTQFRNRANFIRNRLKELGADVHIHGGVRNLKQQ